LLSQPKPVAGPKPGFHSTNVTDDTWACCLDEQAILHAIEMEATAQIDAERAAAAAAAAVRAHRHAFMWERVRRWSGVRLGVERGSFLAN
jgi:hypothetical protein